MPQPALSSAPSGAAHAPGWFGKVVMLGDFAHRRLPQPFIAVCDPWLSHCVGTSRAQLGARWLDTYLTGPVWRFAWAPGVVDGHWWFGVLMPSVDAVGRYFPLLVCSSDQNPPMSSTAFDALTTWYDHAHQAALNTLQPGASLARFEAELAGTPRWQDAAAPPATPATLATQKGGGHERHLLPGQPGVGQWAHALANPLFGAHYARHSFWCPAPAQSDPAEEASLTVVAGLPDPDQFSLMLEGRW
jgi:type VI secretion system protein ImpM